jgi:hypothetical protein
MADQVQHGFLRSGGNYWSIDYPNATGTVANGVNDNAEIVGIWGDGAHGHGYYAVKQ